MRPDLEPSFIHLAPFHQGRGKKPGTPGGDAVSDTGTSGLTPQERKELDRLLDAFRILGEARYLEEDQPSRDAIYAFVARLLASREHQDSQRLDWLEQQDGLGLISDDGGRWAISTAGFQNVPEEEPTDIASTFFVPKGEWKTKVREAIDAARSAEGGTQ